MFRFSIVHGTVLSKNISDESVLCCETVSSTLPSSHLPLSQHFGFACEAGELLLLPCHTVMILCIYIKSRTTDIICLPNSGLNA